MEQIAICLSMVHKFTNLCLGDISKHGSTDNMKRTRFNGYVYDYSLDYDATDVEYIKDIHKYLMKKIT